MNETDRESIPYILKRRKPNDRVIERMKNEGEKKRHGCKNRFLFPYAKKKTKGKSDMYRKKGGEACDRKVLRDRRFRQGKSRSERKSDKKDIV